MKLFVLEFDYAVCKLKLGESIPPKVLGSDFYSVSKTADELSLVCLASLAPKGIKSEAGWRILKVEGPLDFSLTGVLSSILRPLADAKISIFAISTFDTDYVMVKNEKLEAACSVLKMAGFEIANHAPS